MSAPIDLFPSTEPDAFANAILQASTDNMDIVLHPGLHFTKPGQGKNHRIKIGENGLRIKGSVFGSEYAIIKRPDFSIPIGSIEEDNYSKEADDNYGLFFIPDDATLADFALVTSWKEHTDENNNTFQFTVIIRGSIVIENLFIDCNMGNQNLHALYENPPVNKKRPAEHSCMLGFAGTSTKGTGDYEGKKIYIAFSEVVIKNMITINGGFADDIWISRGYFNPNIERVTITDIISVNRVDPHRGTICFSGLAQTIEIENADIYRLECEETSSRWDELPRKKNSLRLSQWNLRQITADRIEIAAKGKAIWMNATHLYSKLSFNVYQVGGTIAYSILNKGSESRLNRLNKLVFENVTWILTAKDTGEMFGIRPTAQYGEVCEASFINNDFKVNGVFTNGSLITSEYSRELPENEVKVTFRDCTYDLRFGSPVFPDTFIISANERGTWRIQNSDFGNRSINRALHTNTAHAEVIIQFI